MTDRDSVVLALTSDLGSSADVMPSSSGRGGGGETEGGQTGKWSYVVKSSVVILKQCQEFSASIFFLQPRICPIVV